MPTARHDRSWKTEVVELLDQLDDMLRFLARERLRMDDLDDIRQDLAVILVERLCRSPTASTPSEDDVYWKILSLLEAPRASALAVSGTFDRFATQVMRVEEMLIAEGASPEGVADVFGVTADRVRLARLVRRPPISLALPVPEMTVGSEVPLPPEATLEDTLVDPQADVADQVVESLHGRELLSHMSDTARSLLELRFGLNGNRAISREVAARHLGFSQETVAALERHAIATVQAHMVRAGVSR